jgi:hypothetical protein
MACGKYSRVNYTANIQRVKYLNPHGVAWFSQSFLHAHRLNSPDTEPLRQVPRQKSEGRTMTFGPLLIFVDCNEPGCIAEAVVWSGNPMETEVIYTTPEGWYINYDEGVAWCPEHRKHGR